MLVTSVYLALVPLLFGLVALVQLLATSPAPIMSLCISGTGCTTAPTLELCDGCSTILRDNYICQWTSCGVLACACIVWICMKKGPSTTVMRAVAAAALLISLVPAVIFGAQSNGRIYKHITAAERQQNVKMGGDIDNKISVVSLEGQERGVVVAALSTAAVFFSGSAALLLLASCRK